MPSALIDVLLPCYNSSNTISKSVESLLAQDFTDFRCIVLDNCSQDSTFKIVKNLVCDDPRFFLISNKKNLGVASSFYRLIHMAKAPFVIFLAADDYYHPQCLSLLYQSLTSSPHAVAACPSTLRFRDDGYRKLSDGTFPIEGMTALHRMSIYLSSLTDNSRFYGLYRNPALQESNVLMNFFAADLVLTALTLRFGSHLEISSKNHQPLLFRELPLSMRKYVSRNSSVFYVVKLFLTPFLDGACELCRRISLSAFCALLPKITFLNLKLSWSLVRAYLASSAQLRKLYFVFSRA